MKPSIPITIIAASAALECAALLFYSNHVPTSRVAPAITTVEATSASAANDSSKHAALNTVAVEQSAAAVSYIEQPPVAAPPAPAYVPLQAPAAPAVRQMPVYGPRGRIRRYRTVTR